MKRLWPALAVFATWAPAMGAELSVKKPVTKAPIAATLPSWAGFYAGLNFGWGNSRGAFTNGSGSAVVGDLSVLDPIDNSGRTQAAALAGTALANTAGTTLNQNGFIGGLQFGYNYQWSSNYVVGIEADIQKTRIRGGGSYAGSATNVFELTPESIGTAPDTVFNTTGAGTVTAGIDWIGTVRGRLGYTLTPMLLTYGTGGLAYGHVRISAFHTSQTQIVGFEEGVFENVEGTGQAAGAGFYSGTRVGWTAGGGLEWMFAPNWSLKTEALYYDLGRATAVSTPMVTSLSSFGTVFRGLAIATPATTVHFDGVIARAGVNYRFDWFR